MRIPRIYHPEPIPIEQAFALSSDAVNHVANVLRLKVGHPIVLFNGDGNEYSGEIEDVSKRHVSVIADAKLSLSVESPLPLHLGQGVSRGDRMDWVIQKSVELGVTEITPLITERCGVKLNQERWQKKTNQWQKIIVSACEQCGRNVLPVLHEPTELSQWLAQSTEQLRLTLHPRAEQRFASLPMPHHGARLLIGPEGGFTDSEIYAGEQAGFSSVKMGPRVLRTETAAIAAISAIQSVYGDI